jgi:hypothetical protein
MITGTENSPVTDIENVKFEIQKDDAPAAAPVAPVASTTTDTPPATPTVPGTDQPPANPENKTTPGTAPDPLKNASPENNNTPSNNEPQDYEVGLEEFNSLVSEASNGKVKSLDELNAKIARLDELEANPSILFKDDHQKKIYEFLSKYQQDDYAQGIQTFAKLQQLDIQNLTPEAALEELYILENAKMGLSKEDAKAMFKHELEAKYESKGEVGESFKKRDAYEAKLKLEQMKKDVNVPKVESQQEQQSAELRQNYLSQVEKSFSNELGPFKDISISFSENSEEDYTYPISDPSKIQNAMANYTDYFSERYVREDGTYNMEQMKLDITAAMHLPDMLHKAFEHGKSIGGEAEIKRRNNVPLSGTPPSNANQLGTPKDLQQEILEGMGKQ